jgi:hypothetical protein
VLRGVILPETGGTIILFRILRIDIAARRPAARCDQVILCSIDGNPVNPGVERTVTPKAVQGPVT